MDEIKRYNSVAISLHWLIAILIIGLLAMGKFMTRLEDTDPFRFTLTQWHKSVGITVLLLVLLRILWRLTHKPPALPKSATGFERVASHLTHAAIYALMVIVPASGWVMVSASPLNLETVLYGVIPWPHLPYLPDTPANELLADRSAMLHGWFANTLLILVLLHVAAAFFHQWVRRDKLISRMLVSASHKNSRDLNHGLVTGVLLAGAGGLFLANTASKEVAGIMTDGTRVSVNQVNATRRLEPASVGFTALQLGEPVVGSFGDAQVQLVINKESIASSVLTAKVMTGSVKTTDAQLDATIVTSDWFASEKFPQATFVATNFSQKDTTAFQVAGDLTIKGVSQPVEFELVLEEKWGRGEFVVNRSDFGVGDAGQDEFVDPEVVIRFEVQDEGSIPD